MKLPYFKLGDAFSAVKNGEGFSGKAGSIAMLAGKTAANVGMLAVEAGVHIVKNAPVIAGRHAEEALKNPDLTAAQRSQFEEAARKGRVVQQNLYDAEDREAAEEPIKQAAKEAKKAYMAAGRKAQQERQAEEERREREREERAAKRAAAQTNDKSS